MCYYVILNYYIKANYNVRVSPLIKKDISPLRLLKERRLLKYSSHIFTYVDIYLKWLTIIFSMNAEKQMLHGSTF